MKCLSVLLILAGSSHFALRFLQHSCCWRPVRVARNSRSPPLILYQRQMIPTRYLLTNLLTDKSFFCCKRINQFDFRLKIINQKYKFKIKHFYSNIFLKKWMVAIQGSVCLLCFLFECVKENKQINMRLKSKTADSFTKQPVRSEFTSIVVYSTSTTRFLGSHKCKYNYNIAFYI